MIDDTFRAASPKTSLSESISIWRGRDIEHWSRSPGIYRSLAEKVLAQGEPLLAYDIVSEALAKWPEDIRFRQLQGLALARSGATERANAALEKLRQEGQTDEETLGMLARTYKDLAARAASAEERQDSLRRAAEIYTQAYESSHGNWSGINAATMSLLVGQTEHAVQLAKQVQRQCQEALSGEDDQYWLLAALGEAALIQREWADAEKWYERAAKKSARRFGDLASTRRNARLIFQRWEADPTKVENYLRVPPVVVFSGHMIDSPDRVTPRFPASLEPAVAKALSDKISELKPGFGFASAACGSDILFLEAMLDAGAEVSVVLPYNKNEFIRESVDFVPNSNWGERFERVLKRAAHLVTASTERLEVGSVSLEFGNTLLLGLATLYANRLEADIVSLTVWDRKSGDGPGGTASAVENWQRLGYTPEIIDLTQFSESGTSIAPVVLVDDDRKPSSARDSKEFASRIVAILFADAVGFSKLSEYEVPRFVQHFLGPIAQLSRSLGEGLIAKNTWGDGLYFVFSDIHLAGKFALELADLISATSWREKGLRSDLSLRIALHAGPVYEFDDPVTGNRSYSGTHVSRAARIEPITPPGQVYASEAFAALAAAGGGTVFTCDYVGQTALAKGYGTLPMYHVRWRADGARL